MNYVKHAKKHSESKLVHNVVNKAMRLLPSLNNYASSCTNYGQTGVYNRALALAADGGYCAVVGMRLGCRILLTSSTQLLRRPPRFIGSRIAMPTRA